MDLHLSDEELAFLSETLTSELGELRMEIADTDNADYKHGLKAKEVLLRGLLSRLGVTV